MSFQGVCEGWAEDLTTHVPELAGARVHLFAPWSPELFHAAVGETHLAVFPGGDPETTVGLLAGTPPTDEVTSLFEADVWKGAASEDARLVENHDEDLAWLELYEACRARLYVVANTGIGGDPNAYTRYTGGRLGTQNSCRYFQLAFSVRWSLAFT